MLLRDYFNSLNSYRTANYSETKLVGVAFKLRKKMKNSPSCAHVLRKKLEVGHFTLLFCRGQWRNVRKCKTHVQSDCFCSLNLLFCGVVVAVALLKPATHLAILYADRGEFDRQRKFSPPIDADTPGNFFRWSRRCGSFENSCDKIAQPDGLALLAIHSNKRRKSREWAHLANPSEFNRRYLACQISAILYADRGERRKSQSLHRAHLAIFADRGDRRIKSPSVSLA